MSESTLPAASLNLFDFFCFVLFGLANFRVKNQMNSKLFQLNIMSFVKIDRQKKHSTTESKKKKKLADEIGWNFQLITDEKLNYKFFQSITSVRSIFESILLNFLISLFKDWWFFVCLWGKSKLNNNLMAFYFKQQQQNFCWFLFNNSFQLL